MNFKDLSPKGDVKGGAGGDDPYFSSNAVLRINGHSITFGWIRFIIQIIITLVVAAGVYFKLDNRVSNNTEQILANARTISSMDQGGTRKSHETDNAQQQQLDYFEKRMSAVEKQLGDLMPKVDRIDTNLLWVMSRMKDGQGPR